MYFFRLHIPPKYNSHFAPSLAKGRWLLVLFQGQKSEGIQLKTSINFPKSPLPSQSTRPWIGPPSPSRGRNPLLLLNPIITMYFLDMTIIYAPSLDKGRWLLDLFQGQKSEGIQLNTPIRLPTSPLPSQSTRSWIGPPSPSRGRSSLILTTIEIIPYFLQNTG